MTGTGCSTTGMPSSLVFAKGIRDSESERVIAGSLYYVRFSSMLRSAFTNVKISPEKTVITAARSKAWLQP